MSDNNANQKTSKVNRRQLLQGLAATGTAAGLGISVSSGTAAAASSADRSTAAGYRDTATDFFVEDGSFSPFTQITNTSNDDEQHKPSTRYDRFVAAVYNKSLPQGIANGTNEDIWNDLVNVIENDGDPNNIPTAQGRAQVEPHAGNHFNSEGIDPRMGIMPEAPAFESSETAASLLETYYMALFRDVPLSELENYNSSWTNSYQTEMAQYEANNPWIDTANSDNWFRGVFEGTRTGPYISQFYLQEAGFGGGLPFTPTVAPLSETDYAYNETDNGATDPSYLAMREGKYGGAEPGGNYDTPEVSRGSERWITTGRDLASIVRDEPSYHHYYMAALQLLDWGANLSETVNEAETLKADMASTTLRYINHGAVGILDLLARVARNALNAAWYHKWNVHMRKRPEGAAGNAEVDAYVHQSVTDSKNNSNSSAQDIVDRIGNMYDGYAYLPLAYPEGSPTHPSYPSGHSVIAGACVTVLKALFEDTTFDNLDEFSSGGNLDAMAPPTSTGGGRQPATGAESNITVHGELNKLADNIGTARMWAGVHYWRDHIWGARLGEQIAVATLMQVVNDRSEFKTSRSSAPDAPRYVFEFTPLKQGSGPIRTNQEDLDTLRQNSETRPW